jgi:flagellar biosynthesis/type III secretory pathway protein FliH
LLGILDKTSLPHARKEERKEGREGGMEQGRKEGTKGDREEGRKEGRKERRKEKNRPEEFLGLKKHFLGHLSLAEEKAQLKSKLRT